MIKYLEHQIMAIEIHSSLPLLSLSANSSDRRTRNWIHHLPFYLLVGLTTDAFTLIIIMYLSSTIWNQKMYLSALHNKKNKKQDQLCRQIEKRATVARKSSPADRNLAQIQLQRAIICLQITQKLLSDGRLVCSHQASLEIWPCKMAADWDQDPWAMHILVGK